MEFAFWQTSNSLDQQNLEKEFIGGVAVKIIEEFEFQLQKF